MTSLLSLLLIACAPITADSAEPTVDCPSASIAAPGFHASLQAAIDVAEDGAVLCVAPGSWDSVVIDHPLTLVGGAGPTRTELNGQGDGPVVTVVDAGRVTLDGVSVTGGVAAEGGGVLAIGATHLRLVDVLVSANTAARGGGVAVVEGAFFEAQDTVILRNHAERGGGLWASDAALDTVSLQLLSNQPDDLACDRSYGCD